MILCWPCGKNAVNIDSDAAQGKKLVSQSQCTGLNIERADNLKRREFVTTDTELIAIAAAEKTGFRRMPKKG